MIYIHTFQKGVIKIRQVKIELEKSSQHIKELEDRRNYLKKLEMDIENALAYTPEGHLRIRNDSGKQRYYHITNTNDTQGKYIRKKNVELAYQLAQKDYMQKLCNEVRQEIGDIDKFLSKYTENTIENVYNNLNDYRKKLVTPMVIADEVYASCWEKELYESNPYNPEEKVYSTKKDELVRSKSEVLLADMYYELGIPYRYEAKLQLQNGKTKYPDFTLLKPKTREIIYHEHLGLLDDEEYRLANLRKLDEYRKSGIYMGKNLIITYEAQGCYLNIKEIKQMMVELLLL